MKISIEFITELTIIRLVDFGNKFSTFTQSSCFNISRTVRKSRFARSDGPLALLEEGKRLDILCGLPNGIKTFLQSWLWSYSAPASALALLFVVRKANWS